MCVYVCLCVFSPNWLWHLIGHVPANVSVGGQTEIGGWGGLRTRWRPPGLTLKTDKAFRLCVLAISDI